MTDRVQPGAIDSIVRNDELSQVFNQFSAGWVVDVSNSPGTTPAARRRGNIDDTALNSFALASTSGRDVTIDAGEAFVGGWCVRDVQTTITVPQNTTATVVAGWDLDAQFNPSTNSNRDDADETIVALERNVNPEYPVTELFSVQTNSSSVSQTTDLRRLGPTATLKTVDAETVEADTVDATSVVADSADVTTGNIDTVNATSVDSDSATVTTADITTGNIDTVDVADAAELPVYQSRGNIPASLAEGSIVYVLDEDIVFRVGGTDTDPVAAATALATDFVMN
jgi:hypothetical protein